MKAGKLLIYQFIFIFVYLDSVFFYSFFEVSNVSALLAILLWAIPAFDG